MEKEKEKNFSVIFCGTRALYNKVISGVIGKCTTIVEEYMMVSVDKKTN
jgi:hypothetical protein